MNLYIKVGSVTNAQRGQRALRSKGYKAQIARVDNMTAKDGCGWMLVVRSYDNEPVSILEDEGIMIRGVEKR